MFFPPVAINSIMLLQLPVSFYSHAQFVTPRRSLCNQASHVAGLALEVLYFHYADPSPSIYCVTNTLTTPRGIHSFCRSSQVIKRQTSIMAFKPASSHSARERCVCDYKICSQVCSYDNPPFRNWLKALSSFAKDVRNNGKKMD